MSSSSSSDDFLFPELPLSTALHSEEGIQEESKEKSQKKAKIKLSFEEQCDAIASLVKTQDSKQLDEFLQVHPIKKAIRCEGMRLMNFALKHFNQEVMDVLSERGMSLAYEQSALVELFIQQNLPAASWLIKKASLSSFVLGNALWELETANLPADAYLSIFEGLKKEGYHVAFLPISNHTTPSIDRKKTVFLSSTVYCSVMGKAVHEENKKLFDILFDACCINVKHLEKINSDKHSDLRWVLRHIICKTMTYKNIGFVMKQIQEDPQRKIIWRDSFPVPDTLIMLKSQLPENRFYDRQNIKASNFVELCMVTGSHVVPEIIRHPKGKEAVLKIFNDHPDRVFGYLNQMSSKNLSSFVPQLLPDLKHWKDNNGRNVVFLWFAATPSKSLALQMSTSFSGMLLEQDSHGQDALHFLKEEDRSVVEKKLMQSHLHKNKLGLVSKAGKKAPSRRL